MDKPGPGDHVIRPSLIIDSSGKRPAWRRRLDWLLSAAMWILYLYFIREALADLYELGTEAFAWAFRGADWPELPSMSRLYGTLLTYGIVAAANGALLIAWALYNQARFRGQDRHVAQTPVVPADLAELYRVPTASVVEWQAARIMTMRHGPDGSLIDVDVK